MTIKKLGIIGLICFTGLMSVGCSGAEETVMEQSRSVEVIETKITENEVRLPYIGTVNSKEIVKYSFKSPGKIAAVHVKKGQSVVVGDPLVELDRQELKFQLDASRATLETAKLNVLKAEDAMNYDKEYSLKIKDLYEADAVSKDTYDKLSLKAQVSDSSYKQAIEQSNAAQVDYDYKSYLINHTVLKAESDGMIVEVISKENEQVGAYYPVVAVRSDVQVVNVGIAQRDLEIVKEGMKAVVDVNGNIAEGYISLISEAPDASTRTYNAEIILNDSTFRLGSIAKVEFKAGKKAGMWVPVKSVLSDGEDFVYIIEDGRSFKKTVEPKSIHNGVMEVVGLDEGDLVVTSGMKNLSDGFKVIIKE